MNVPPSDIGGSALDGSIPRGEHAFAPWELRTHAMLVVLADPSLPGGALMSDDELRRGVESLSADEYRERSYYERWLLSMAMILEEKGRIDRAALEGRIAELAVETSR
jgi:hypothetical protein